MTLEDALAWSAERGGDLPVTNANGQTIGVITSDRLASAVSGRHDG